MLDRTDVRSWGEIARIVGRSLSLAVADISNRLMGLLVVIVVSRRFGTVGLGQVSVALALAAYVQASADFGFKTAGARLVARLPEHRWGIAARTRSARGRLVALSALAAIAYWVATTGLSVSTTAMLALLMLAQGFMALTDDWMAWGLGRMHMLAAYRMIVQVGGGLVAIGLIYALGLIWMIGPGYAAAAMAGWVYVGTRLGWWGHREQPSDHRDESRTGIAEQLAFKRVAPLGLATFLVIFYQTGDLLVLQWLVSWHQVGLYSAAGKLIVSACALVSVVAQVVFPHLVRSRSDGSFEPIKGRVFVLVVGGALVVTAALILLADPIVSLIYGQKLQGAAEFLKGLAPCVALDSICTLWMVTRYAAGRYVEALRLAAMGSAAMLVCGIVMVEHFGVLGIIPAKLIAYGLMCSSIGLQKFRRVGNVAPVQGR